MIKLLDKIKQFFCNLFKTGNKLIIGQQKTFEDELFKKYGKSREQKKNNLKVLFITDTHNCLSYEKETLEYIKNIKDYDYCILLGDHSAEDLYEITKIIPKDKLCGVLGNHDSWDKYKEYGINNIDGNVIDINGVKIAGMSGSYKYKNSDQYALYTHEESIDIANRMDEADILVSHDKPYTEKQFGDAHDGLKGITEYIYKNKIPLHIHGHLHEESEDILKNGTKTICIYKVKLMEL